MVIVYGAQFTHTHTHTQTHTHTCRPCIKSKAIVERSCSVTGATVEVTALYTQKFSKVSSQKFSIVRNTPLSVILKTHLKSKATVEKIWSETGAIVEVTVLDAQKF